MNSNDLKKYIGYENTTVMKAMEMIDFNAKGIIYIVDDVGRLTGSLSDGDIRRWILKTGSLDGTALQMSCKTPVSVFEEESYKCEELMNSKQIKSVPIINKNYEVIDIYFKNGETDKGMPENRHMLDSIPVIIMAGGKGKRLYPYTKILPKPLIPINDIPILERILNRFYQFGVTEFYVTVNYKKEMIKAYFAEIHHPYVIRYVEEDQPMGTAGSIRLIKDRLTKPVIVTNCDILIDIDYADVMEHHCISGNDMTIVSSLKHTTIPYGVLHTKEQGVIISMEEKPQLSYIINTGMYIINPEFFKWIPDNDVSHMTDLAEKMIRMDGQVGIYPISEKSFLDMGQFEEMKKMEERINGGFI